MTVNELADDFDLSVDSIRKDLQYLARKKKCRRVYGGAIKNAPATHAVQEVDASTDHPISDAASLDGEVVSVDEVDTARLALAQRAFLEINSGDFIFLDISQTNLLLARLLAQSDKRLIVTTNMLGIMRELSNRPQITAIATGGYLNVQLNGFVGSTTVSMLEPLLFEKAFIGVSGINIDKLVATSKDIDSGMVKKQAMKNATYKFLMVDSDKFSKPGAFEFASLDDFSAIITDSDNHLILDKIRRRGIPILQPV